MRNVSVFDKEKWCGCAACRNVCPAKCITMTRDQEGFLYPEVDVSRCLQCGKCVSVCPFHVETSGRNKTPKVYGINARDRKIREESSSGGVFTLLAEEVLNRHGIVYGVALNSEKLTEPVYISVRNKSELAHLRGSKYVQASIDDVYIKVKRNLDDGEMVLFSGTPCQINALRNYLQKDYDNLICAELICHGVPSQLLLEKYIAYLEKSYQASVEEIHFRSKTIPNQRVRRQGNTVEIHMPKDECPYLTMFLRNYALRPSCYHCVVKRNESLADLTLADLWGVAQIAPVLDDGRGTSAVIVQSEKGQLLLNSILEYAEFEEVSFDEAIRKHNSSYCSDEPKPVERATFYQDLNRMSFKEMEHQYIRQSRAARLKQGIKRTPLYALLRILRRKRHASHLDVPVHSRIVLRKKTNKSTIPTKSST